MIMQIEIELYFNMYIYLHTRDECESEWLHIGSD